MNPHRSLVLLAAVALSAATLGACSKGSPTEPTPLVELDSFSASSESSSFTAVPDDGKRRGRGGDDGTADDSGGRGRGRGGDDGQADDRGGRHGRGGRGNGNGDANDDSPRPRQPRQPGQPGQAGLEFEGSVLSVSGQTINLAGGTRVIVNGQTQWIARGDLFTLGQVAGSAASGAPTRVEGRGTRRADGAILALTIKAEVDN